MNRLRRVLAVEISVAGLLELGLWLALPNVVIGIGVAFMKAQYAHHFAEQFELWLPAGAQLAGFGLAMVLWPILLFAPQVCAI
ncbi:hypothetical protein JRC04_20705 [Mycolicibacterium sp. S2-37]|uniref:hypothetical protein n=1 Tax=Mycolicibacterium sp. S2-37 TaxID=2810297 RepID=UPI001A9409D7|nr:hypothetical protein [Mycolicibacterium sp. S2-37]MBO0679896.1 hypothetical protein [Mycolicibacterium sp. S2-37]